MIRSCKDNGQGCCFADGKCHHNGECENAYISNADRIRALTDGELAATLIHYDDGCGMWFGPGGMYENREDALGNALDWLKKPVEVIADG